eukprot:m.267277 g.267277  ORF g.267277 m.267277 type:complete len:487 (-) comp72135_c0_seq1:281-1741(-)
MQTIMVSRASCLCAFVLTNLAITAGADSHGPWGTGITDVTGFGAKADGVHDDAAAIQAAVLNVTYGGIIWFPPGVYLVGSVVTVSGYDIQLRGAGALTACASAGTMFLAPTGNSSLLVFDACTQCKVEGIRFTHINEPNCTFQDALHRTQQFRQSTKLMRTGRQRILPAIGHGLTGALPTTGAAITVSRSFSTVITGVVIDSVWNGFDIYNMANTITITDSFILNVYGPYGVRAGGKAAGERVDILQIQRITTNNNRQGTNSSTIWIYIGSGCNTVRLDNVGLINGGVGVQMTSDLDNPAGVFPGRPLFLFANDLEIDFPTRNAVELLRGEEVQMSNTYLQGGGTGTRGPIPSGFGTGLYVGPSWNSELIVSNTRIFGNSGPGIQLSGGTQTVISNNVITQNSIAAIGQSSGIIIDAGVQGFIISNNHIGGLGSGKAGTKCGIEVTRGASDNYVIMGNVLLGNQVGTVCDNGVGKNKSVVNNIPFT